MSGHTGPPLGNRDAAVTRRSGPPCYHGRVKSHHYWKAVDAFKGQLRDAVPHEELKALHTRSGPRHLAYASGSSRSSASAATASFI